MPMKEYDVLTDSSNEDDIQASNKNKITRSEVNKFIGHLKKVTVTHTRRLVLNADTPHEAWKVLKKKHEVSKNNVNFTKLANGWNMLMVKDAAVNPDKVFYVLS